MSNAPEAAQEQKQHTIIVNGREKPVTGKEISYDEIIHLAFNPVPTGENVVITVTYRKGEGNKEGSMLPGDTVKIKDRMVFDVRATDRS